MENNGTMKKGEQGEKYSKSNIYIYIYIYIYYSIL